MKLPLFSKNLSGDQWLAIAETVQASADEDGLVLFDTVSGRVFTGNQVAALVWLSASEGLTMDAAAEEIATRFSIPFDRAKRDIQMFLGEFERSGLGATGAR